MTEATAPPAAAAPAHPLRAGVRLFVVSWLVLFLELACIRWFPAHVLFLTFFTNAVLLACFLGMSVGCLAAGHFRRYLAWTPLLLALALAAGHAVEYARTHAGVEVAVSQSAPQEIFFGTEKGVQDVARFPVPIEAVAGAFFLLLALAFVGPGQELGRALNATPDRVRAYTVNVAGSVAGIALFALASWCELPPLWWFVPVALGLLWLLRPLRPLRPLPLAGQAALLALAVAAAAVEPSYQAAEVDHYWSPYYRIDYRPDDKNISVNLIGHQEMSSRAAPFPAYALPHLLNRDAGGERFRDVLIIGAGSGNDVSRALEWGADHVDAVEIDPVIQRLGARDHPDGPYNDARVAVHLDDGRNFLRSAGPGKYDLIVYALVDSLVLHSSYSNIRLESYLFTEEAFRDVKKCLKKGGTFVVYNYFRQGWLVARVRQTLADAFGAPPLVMSLPYQEEIDPERPTGFTAFFAGETGKLSEAFEKRPEYWLPADRAPDAATPNGFTTPAPEGADEDNWRRFGLAAVKAPAEPLRDASDDWPFLYVRRPMLPDLSLRGAAVMGGLALALLWLFRPREPVNGNGQAGWRMTGRMFFLGAGFMLIETKAVVNMALLFGGTWMVNTVVFFAVLVMILLANLFVLRFRPRNLTPYYTGLLLTLALNAAVPLDFFLGMDRWAQIGGSCLLVFAPIAFAAVIFAVSFARASHPDLAFGANIAGAMLGGLAEYASMLLGFQHLMLVALAFYALAIACRLPPAAAAEPGGAPLPAPAPSAAAGVP
jgi:hypothetical protein